MGYTHYYQIKGARSNEWKDAWPKLIQVAQKIVDAGGVGIVEPGGGENEWYEHEKDIPPAIINVAEGIQLNGIGDDSHESLIITLDDEWKFCKTAEKLYDLVVSCILLRAYTLVPERFGLSSDGRWDEEWVEPRDLYHRLWPEEKFERPREMRE